MKNKKIILFIVEGITDQTSLGLVLHHILNDCSVQFQLTNGDVTSKTGANSHNIAAKMGDIVKKFSGSIFKPKDFLEVVHLVDTDGAFIEDEHVLLDGKKAIYYTNDTIFTNNPNGIKKRNLQKSHVLERLVALEKVWKTIPYSVYYFSSNLDHVMHNKQNLTYKEKNRFSIEFEQKYSENGEGFLEFMNGNDIKAEGDYYESWKFIKTGENSLNRYSNFHVYLNKFVDR